jgi:hypothetical protein
MSKQQCCQLLADFSGQFSGKIRPLRRKFSHFEGILPYRNKTIFVYVRRKSIIVLGLAYNYIRRVGKETFQKFGPFFDPF